MINVIPVEMITDSKDNTCMAVFTEDWMWSNKAGFVWIFKKGDVSDGHSTGAYFRHFDAWVIAALCHDQGCIEANKDKNYNRRRKVDKAYKMNLKELGASWSTVHRRYAAVSAYSRWLKLKGDLK